MATLRTPVGLKAAANWSGGWHVGLCSVNGPQERPGNIRIKLSASSKVAATISFDGDHCTYSRPSTGSGRRLSRHWRNPRFDFDQVTILFVASPRFILPKKSAQSGQD